MRLIGLTPISLASLVSFLFLTPGFVFSAPVPIDSSIFDTTEKSDLKYGIGFTVSIAQRPFKGVDDQTTTLPYLSFTYKDFYVEGTNIGYKFIKKEKYGIEFLITPRYYETQESFAKNGELDGIDKTKQTFFAGISSQYRSDHATYTVQLLKDIVESDGAELTASVSKNFVISKSVILLPALGITLQDDKLVDHFYGVQANETAVGRPEYKGKSSLNTYLLLTGVWNLTPNFQLLGQLKYESLGSGITDSPIVDEKAIYSYVIGPVYRF